MVSVARIGSSGVTLRRRYCSRRRSLRELSTVTSSVLLLLLLLFPSLSSSFVVVDNGGSIGSNKRIGSGSGGSHMVLSAKPARFEDNVQGVVYVNDKCINCAACSNFAPGTFRRGSEKSDTHHVVYHQPTTEDEIVSARASLAACPVAAIRVETLAERRHGSADNKAAVESSWTTEDDDLVKAMGMNPSRNGGRAKPFPKPFLDDDMTDVYWLGHHNEASFGATPYLVKAKHDGRDVWIMVDTPKYGKSAVEAVTSLTGNPDKGPDYLFLTHVDDTADHGKWVERFPSMKRIFHTADAFGPANWLNDATLQDAEILLQPHPEQEQQQQQQQQLLAYSLDGTPLPSDWMTTFNDDGTTDVVILHTPGHSPGSITLYKEPSSSSSSGDDDNSNSGILFTGDTYGYTTRKGGYMTGFPMYGNDLQLQAKILPKLLELDWQVIAPGHGHPRDYRKNTSSSSSKQATGSREEEMQQAIEEIMVRVQQPLRA